MIPYLAAYGKTHIDVTAPGMIITGPASSTVNGAFTVYFTRSKPNCSGFVSGDISVVAGSASVSGFAAVSNTIDSALITPLAEGLVTIRVNAGTFVDVRGTSNTVSNDFSVTYTDDSGVVYDLQNATITKDTHFRGHVFSMTEVTDGGDTADDQGEMLLGMNNLGGTLCRTGASNTQINLDRYNFGRIDIGMKIATLADYTSLVSAVTQSRAGHPTTVFSYTGGSDNNKLDFISLMLSGRNSDPQTDPNPANAVITYGAGIADTDWISRNNAIRIEKYTISPTLGNWTDFQSKLATIMANVISSGGFYMQGPHWNNYTSDALHLKDYFVLLASIISGQDGYSGSFNSIIEYYFVRESVTSVTGNVKTVTINYTKDYLGSPYENITTSLWIRVNLTGTVYAGEDIAVTHGGKIRSRGSNQYDIEVPLDFTLTQKTFDIIITSSPSYINLTRPTIQRSGQNITSDIPVRVTVYRRTTGQDYATAVVTERSLTIGTAHVLGTTLSAGNTYVVVGISAELVSNYTEFSV